MSIVVVGSVAFDTIATPWGRVERALGGSATYSSVIASFFCPVKIVGIVGEDFTDAHRKVLLDRGIGIDGLETVKDGKTFFWEGRYGQDTNERETVVTQLNVFESFRPVLPDGYRDSKWLFLGNIDPDLQINVLDQVGDDCRIGCDTMNFWIEGKPDSLRRLLERVDIVFINDSEARQLSGEFNLMKAARAILEMGPKAAVIKKGEHGAFLVADDFCFVAPAFPLDNVTDPTGAGDSFAGGFMGYLASVGSLRHGALRKAMIYGTVSASFTCEDFAMKRLETLSEGEIRERFGQLAEMMRVESETGI